MNQYIQPAGGGGDASFAFELSTAYEYDGLENVTTIYHPDHSNAEPRTTAFVYDPNFSQMVSQTSRNDEVTTLQIDSRGAVRRFTEINREGPDRISTNSYSIAPPTISDVAGGLLLTTTIAAASPDEVTTRFDYYGPGNKVSLMKSTTLAQGTVDQAIVRYDYVQRNLTSEIDELSRETNYVYDNLNRLTEVHQPELAATDTSSHSRPVIRYTYDAGGNLRFVEDPRSAANITEMQYDARNRQHKKLLPVPGGDPDTQMPAVVEYLYDNNSNVIQQILHTDGDHSTITSDDRVTDYLYDERNLVVAVQYPASNQPATPVSGPDTSRPTIEYAYDAHGQLKSVRDANSVASGDVYLTTSSYDVLGQLVSVDYPAPGTGDHGPTYVHYFYDLNGNVTQMRTPGVDADFVDDPATANFDESEAVTDYIYDDWGRLTRTTAPADQHGHRQTTVYTYDLRNNLQTVIDTLGNLTGYQYDKRDRVEVAYSPSPGFGHPLEH